MGTRVNDVMVQFLSLSRMETIDLWTGIPIILSIGEVCDNPSPRFGGSHIRCTSCPALYIWRGSIVAIPRELVDVLSNLTLATFKPVSNQAIETHVSTSDKSRSSSSRASTTDNLLTQTLRRGWVKPSTTMFVYACHHRLPIAKRSYLESTNSSFTSLSDAHVYVDAYASSRNHYHDHHRSPSH